jgi:hypothetical protein
MHLLFALVMCTVLTGGSPDASSPANSRAFAESAPADFVVVEARLEPLTPELKKKLDEIETAVKAGKLGVEQAAKRRSQILKDQGLLLFGYFGSEPRVIEVARSDAESVGWSPSAHPSRIRFDRPPAARAARRVLGTPLSTMPQKGWNATSEPFPSEAKYRLHPWLEPSNARLVKVSLDAAIKTTRFVAPRSGRVDTAIGTFKTGGTPPQWIVLVSFTSNEAEPIVGLFDLIDPTGNSLGLVEIERPLQPDEQRDVEVTLYRDPGTSQDLKLRSVTARTCPDAGAGATTNTPSAQPPSAPLKEQ